MTLEKNYAAAMIKFLDREDQTEKAMTYPITEVILIDMSPRVSGLPRRRFFVNPEGKWEEGEPEII